MEKITDKIVVKKLEKKAEMLSAFELVNQMYKKMDFATYQICLDEMITRNDYKMVAAFLDEKIIGVSGYSISLMLYCGRYLQASNLVVDQNCRGLGVGKKILNCLEEIAVTENCQKVVLDSYTENKKSHPLYYRQDFYIRGFHFMKDL
jgi:GNAT superfamily N-acetyltransferase